MSAQHIMEVRWFNFVFGIFSHFSRAGIFLYLLPICLARFRWVVAMTFLPFAGLALYHHAWTPYIWWGAAATFTVTFATTFGVTKTFRW